MSLHRFLCLTTLPLNYTSVILLPMQLTSAATAVAEIFKGSTATATATATATECVSPGKRTQVSGQYLEHLEKLSHLHKSQVLSDTEFEE